MKRLLLVFTCLLALSISQAAADLLTISGAIGGLPAAGVNYVNFDDLALGSAPQTATGPNGTVAVLPGPDSAVVQGNVSGVYAWPHRSNNQGAAFGGAPDGEDQTPYLTTGAGWITLQFAAPQQYFGLLWSSVDSYNSLSLYSSSQGLLGALSGGELSPITGGSSLYTAYININSSVPFDYVVASSGGNAFEFDDVAYSSQPAVFSGISIRSSVPDGGSTSGLLALGVLGLTLLPRRR
jgi:hypothetical protein